MTLKEVIIKDWQYVKCAIIDSQHFYTDVDKVLEYHMENRPTLGPNDIMSFGKYKGKYIEEVGFQGEIGGDWGRLGFGGGVDLRWNRRERGRGRRLGGGLQTGLLGTGLLQAGFGC